MAIKPNQNGRKSNKSVLIWPVKVGILFAEPFFIRKKRLHTENVDEGLFLMRVLSVFHHRTTTLFRGWLRYLFQG
jgi:hypothetical protein